MWGCDLGTLEMEVEEERIYILLLLEVRWMNGMIEGRDL